jgi:hypothetical protein
MDIRTLLDGPDLRSVKHAETLVAYIGEDQSRFDEVFEYLFSPVRTIAMAASDVIETVSVRHPQLLAKHKRKLLTSLNSLHQKEVRWHVAQLLGRLSLTEREALAAANTLEMWVLNDESGIVKVFSFQTIVDLAQQYPAIQSIAERCARWGDVHGMPAMKSRLRILRKKGLLPPQA